MEQNGSHKMTPFAGYCQENPVGWGLSLFSDKLADFANKSGKFQSLSKMPFYFLMGKTKANR